MTDLPPSARAYVLAFEAITVATAAWAMLTDAPPVTLDWYRFAVLVAAGAAHRWLSRRTEETRRDQAAGGPHMDTSVVWILPGMVLLPAWMAVAALILLRVQLYPVARRPLYRYTFGTAGILLAALASMAVMRLAGVSVDNAIGVGDGLFLAGAGVAYFLVNAFAIAGVIALSSAHATWEAIAGSRRDNLGGAVMVCLAVIAALATAHAWLAPLILVPLLAALDWGALQIETARGDARTDHKTQLLNSLGWHEEAGREVDRARRLSGPLAVAVIDLDHFKQVNDTWGHPAGDAVLRAVGAVLRETTRHGDLVGRFGGEEFVLLLPDTDAAAAMSVAERVRRGIADLHVPATDKRGRPVTIGGRTTSIGIAAGSGPATDLDALLRAADAALYEAKQQGRDRIRVAG
ncbi:GGDEF domain-containing protein [Actinokineospora fastidiosa]|uniref:GGDEF domain-containing protein n=1 Tax=Actinokineospora fastidiosa TaxID=1816 RepID=A0A918GLD7_9PSEU|nr:GGDEF domain-containing protein [Actinokineospora fastidiosa]